MDLLQVRNVSKTYGSGEAAVHALKRVCFTVPKGEFVAVVGESGSGKSTLLNIIGALDTPTSGRVFLDGQDIFSMKERNLTVFRRRNIGFIFQSFNLVPELTVEQNLVFPAAAGSSKARPPLPGRTADGTGAERTPPPSAQPAFRRAAAAGSHWPRTHHPPCADPGGRAHRQPRHPEHQRGHHPAERSLPAV